jgi:hypothetical protein
MKSLSDYDFFRIGVAAFHRTPPRRVSKKRGSEKEDTDSRKRLFPYIDRDKSEAKLIKYCRDSITPGSVVFIAETLEIGDIVTLHFLEAFYDDLLFVQKPQGKLESIMNGKVRVSVKCKYKRLLATISICTESKNCHTLLKVKDDPLLRETTCVPFAEILTDPWLHCPWITEGASRNAGIGPTQKACSIDIEPWRLENVPKVGDTVIILGLVHPFDDDAPALVLSSPHKGNRFLVTVIGESDRIFVSRVNCRFGWSAYCEIFPFDTCFRVDSREVMRWAAENFSTKTRVIARHPFCRPVACYKRMPC